MGVRCACGRCPWEPVERMRAVYRCPLCGTMAYKLGARTGVHASHAIVPYMCAEPTCDKPAVVLRPEHKFRKTMRPACADHRPDAAIVEARKTL